MLRHAFRSLLGLLWSMFAVVTVTFFLMHSVPGGPFDDFEKLPLPPEAQQNLLRKYGLDKPVWQQYLLYLWRLLHFDFGVSFFNPTETVLETIGRVWPVSAAIGGITFAVAFVLGTVLGLISAQLHDTWVDHLITIMSTAGITIPQFVLALWLILFFSLRLGWLPTGGWGEPSQWIMPLIAFGVGPTMTVTRYTRISILESKQADYVRTARAKGLAENVILLRHVFKNALITIVTVVGPMVASLTTGSVFIENIFRVPGIGRLFVSSAQQRDYPVIMALVILVAVLWGLIYVITDIAYAWIDPRVRLE